MNISQYIYHIFSIDEKFEIVEFFVDTKGKCKSSKTHYKGDRKSLMDSVVLKEPFVDELLEVIDNNYDYTVDTTLYNDETMRVISFCTMLLN